MDIYGLVTGLIPFRRRRRRLRYFIRQESPPTTVITDRAAFAEMEWELVPFSFLSVDPETWDGNQVPISSQRDRAREDTLCVHPDSVGLADR